MQLNMIAHVDDDDDVVGGACLLLLLARITVGISQQHAVMNSFWMIWIGFGIELENLILIWI